MATIHTSASHVPIPATLLGLAIFALFLRFFLQYGKLRHIPGPLGAKLTNFWLARKLWNGESFVDIARDLDRKYGPVVVYGPNRVLFSDPAAVPVLFNTKDPLPKVNFCFSGRNGQYSSTNRLSVLRLSHTKPLPYQSTASLSQRSPPNAVKPEHPPSRSRSSAPSPPMLF